MHIDRTSSRVSPAFQGLRFENAKAFNNLPESVKKNARNDFKVFNKLTTTDVFVKESGDIIVKDLAKGKSYVPTGNLDGYVPFAKIYPMKYELKDSSDAFEIVYPNFERVDRAMSEHRKYGEEGEKYTSAFAIAKQCHKINAYENFLETIIPTQSEPESKPFKGVRFQSLKAFHQIADNIDKGKEKNFLQHIKKLEEYKTVKVYVKDSGDTIVTDLANEKTYEPTGEIGRHKIYTNNQSLYYELKESPEPFEIAFWNPFFRLNKGMNEYHQKGTKFAAAFDIARALELKNTYEKYPVLVKNISGTVNNNREYDLNNLGYVFYDKFMFQRRIK